MRWMFILLPWMELFSLISLGIETSALTALFYVFATFVLGVLLLRRQGMGMFERLREVQAGRVLGPQLLVDDMAIGFAALLLMFPGMVTDFMAALVMIGPLRRRLATYVFGATPEAYRPQQDRHSKETLEGSFRRLDD